MTELLTKSLCELLPYKTICKDCETDFVGVLGQVDVGFGLVGIKGTNTLNAGRIPYCKPYLFPLSSMTEEQKKEYNRLKHEVPVCHYEYGEPVEEIELYDSPESFKYLIENHFDYYGLIPLDLAIDATNNNPYK